MQMISYTLLVSFQSRIRGLDDEPLSLPVPLSLFSPIPSLLAQTDCQSLLLASGWEEEEGEKQTRPDIFRYHVWIYPTRREMRQIGGGLCGHPPPILHYSTPLLAHINK